MVLLTTTPQIVSLISALPSSALPADLPSDPSSPIDHKTIITLSRLARAHLPSHPTTLNTLLAGAKPYTPPPPRRPQPSASYLALKASLLAQQEQREYNALLRKRQTDDEDGEDEDNIPVSLPFNILLSIILCGGAVFYMTRYWNNAGLRVLLSLGTGIVVGIAEVVVYAGYLRKVKESRRVERRRMEKKEVLVLEDDAVVRAAHATGSGLEGKEEIWGRGVNGGVRRRVREKWEKEQEQVPDIGRQSAKEK